ncbi:hypothetical protein T439DRAFT_305580 [Meredithblackwellia eburnea MCA 4105]
MANLSYAIRCKPDWRTAIRDPTIKAKWKEEALADSFGYLEKLFAHLTERMVDWVLSELEVLKDESPGDAAISCFDGIFESSGRIPASLRNRLLTCVTKLEDVSAEEQDWHPSFNHQVLEVVQPSLFPIVYGRTKTISGEPVKAPNNDFDSELFSSRFCLLPTDFEVSSDAKTVKANSYINNLHPVWNKEMYSVIESVLALSLPLLSSAISPPLPKRIQVPMRFGVDREDGPSFEWYDDKEEEEYREEREQIYKLAPDEEIFSDTFDFTRTIRLPEPPLFSPEQRQRDKNDLYNFGGKTIQIITKLANIHLTPDKPDYPGGEWHLEGMRNENIVASAIYCYDSQNISKPYLAFRSAFDEDDLISVLNEGDRRAARLIFDLEEEEPCVQTLGTAHMAEGVVLAWSNGYQHQVQPFTLLNKEKPGHSKILAFFLVHPEQAIPSTTSILPQQLDWALRDLEECKESAVTQMPKELWDTIENNLKSQCMTLKEAKDYRKDLLAERSAQALRRFNNFPFNMELNDF